MICIGRHILVGKKLSIMKYGELWIKNRKNVLDYTYTAPLAELDKSLVKVEGRWKA